MKRILLVALAIAATLTAGTAAAQPAPYNQAGITMGHWHLASKDVEANKKLFVAMGGKLFNPGGQPLIMFPGLYISLILGNEKGEGGTVGSVAVLVPRSEVSAPPLSSTCLSKNHWIGTSRMSKLFLMN